MNRRTLTITLLSPAAFTEDGATIGGATTLTRVPGGTLLGAAAARLAPRGGAERSKEFERAFINGEVRFGDGLPVHDEVVCLPMPLSLHSEKGKRDAAWTNLAVQDYPKGKQLKQERDGYLTASNQQLKLSTRLSMRTAIDADGRARNRHLYTIKTVPSGLVFQAEISSEDDKLLQHVCDALCGEQRLGRSRTAELGAVKITCSEAKPIPSPQAKGDAVLLCLSDLALRDPTTGAPTLRLTPQALGLPEGSVVQHDRCFIRTRRYSPFNGHRRRPGLERQVIVAGSVIVIQIPEGTDRAALAVDLYQGVGEFVASGLGRIQLDPDCVQRASIEVTQVSTRRSSRSQPPNDNLGRWLLQHHERAAIDLELDQWVEETADSLAKDCRRVPRAQWGSIRDLSASAVANRWSASRFTDELKKFLKGGTTQMIWHGAGRADDKLLKIVNHASSKGEDRTTSVDLEQHLTADSNLAAAMQRVAARVPRALAKKEHA